MEDRRDEREVRNEIKAWIAHRAGDSMGISYDIKRVSDDFDYEVEITLPDESLHKYLYSAKGYTGEDLDTYIRDAILELGKTIH